MSWRTPQNGLLGNELLSFLGEVWFTAKFFVIVSTMRLHMYLEVLIQSESSSTHEYLESALVG